MYSLIASLISLALTILFSYLSYFYYGQATYFLTYLILAAVCLALTVVFFMLILNKKNKEKITWLENRLNVWNSISHHVSAAGDEAFTKLPIGIIVLIPIWKSNGPMTTQKVFFQ